MRTSKTIGKLRFYFGYDRLTAVTGVNSKLPNDLHFLMWDFDGETKRAVHDSLKRVQLRRKLPPIYVLGTGRPDSFHAYCFKAHSWRDTFNIIWETAKVDPTYVKMGFVRGYFTLRFSEKSGRDISFDSMLKSQVLEDVDPREISNFVRYLTKGG